MSAEEPSLSNSPVSGQNSSNSSVSFPSVSELFRQSWEAFTKSVFHLFVLSIIGLVSYIIIAVLAIVILFLTGVGAMLFQQSSSGKILESIFQSPTVLITLGILIVVGFIAFIVIGVVIQVASIIIVSEYKAPVSYGKLFRKGLGFVLPLFFVGILTFFITFGSFFVFVLPAIFFGFLLFFSQYEVVLADNRGTKALSRSAFITISNFWPILGRVMLIWLIFFVIGITMFVVNLFLALIPVVGVFMQIGFSLFNVVLGWFALCYYVTLYRHARGAVKTEGTTKLVWLWVVAIIGWLIFAGVIFVGYKALSSENFKNLFSKEPFSKEIKVNNSLSNIKKSINEMSPQAKVHWDRSQDLFKQMRAVQTTPQQVQKLNDENIAELKQVLAMEPNNARVWYELGSAYTWLSSGTLEDGLAAFQKAEELDPTNTVYINGVGDMLIRMEKYEDAILQFQKTLRLTDKSGYAYLSLGTAYSKLKVYDSARENFQKAIEIFKSENSDGSHDEDILQAQKEMAALPK